VSVAFAKADDILATAVKGIAEIITVAGYINVDFADVETVMKDSGVAVMGMGRASGENRAISAIEAALNSPLLNSSDITGAKSILINIISGTGEAEITMDELGDLTDYMYDVASDEALIIRGLSKDDALGDEISVIVIATGFESNSVIEPYKPADQTERVTLFPERRQAPVRPLPGPDSEMFRVKDKGSLIGDTSEGKIQGKLNFGDGEELIEKSYKSSARLDKLKEMQTILNKEGMTNKVLTQNIENFEDVPAYVRRNILLNKSETVSKSQVSKLTLSTDEDQQPVIRDNNAYLNDNVD
jgi:cell division protein FtsZ